MSNISPWKFPSRTFPLNQQTINLTLTTLTEKGKGKMSDGRTVQGKLSVSRELLMIRAMNQQRKDDITGVEKGEWEIKRLGWGRRREPESWFQRQGEVCGKERSFIRNEDDVGGRVTRDEQWVLRGISTEMRLWRYVGQMVVRTKYAKKLVFDMFSDSEPVERAWDGSDITGLKTFNDSTSKRVLNLLETVNWT